MYSVRSCEGQQQQQQQQRVDAVTTKAGVVSVQFIRMLTAVMSG
jgi:hypothetical protein